MAPMVLWASGITEALQRPHLNVDWHCTLETAERSPDHDMRLDEAYEAVLHMSKGLAREVEEIFHAQPLTVPVVIGGDHSVAIGTWSGVTNALAAHKKMGLLWVDAHVDAHTPITSVQGGWGGHFHGMPLAHLLGHGDKDLCEIGSKKVKFDPRYVALVGTRSFEAGEAKLLKDMGVTVFTMNDIAQQGLQNIMQQALAIVGKAPMGWGLSLDVDVFDPIDMPCVGTPEPNGIRTQSFLQSLSALKLPSFPRAVEIVEYMPNKDPSGDGIKFIEKFLWLLFKK